MENTIKRLWYSSKEQTIQSALEKGFNNENGIFPILENEEHSLYRQTIGFSNTLILDTAYPVGLLSKYLVNPRECHLNPLSISKKIIDYWVLIKMS